MYLLFHKEKCPYSQKVRQFMSDQNISYISIISNGDSPSRKMIDKLGGKSQVPFLVDVDKGTVIYESGDIIDYLS